jgi:hypothetical protein
MNAPEVVERLQPQPRHVFIVLIVFEAVIFNRFRYRRRADVAFFGGRVITLVFQNRAQIAEGCGHVRVIGPFNLLEERNRAAKEFLSLVIAPVAAGLHRRVVQSAGFVGQSVDPVGIGIRQCLHLCRRVHFALHPYKR